MLKFLALGAIASFAAALLLAGLVPGQRYLAVHLALALGVFPLILGAMTYFVPVLTRTRAGAPVVMALPLLAALAGLLAVTGFVLPDQRAVSHLMAALLGLIAVGGLAIWMVRRSRQAIGGAHPGVYWYVAALGALLVALAAILAMPLWPEQHVPLRRLHLHLNLLGFVALTAVGTLQVLMPTVVGRADPLVAGRLRRDLKWAVSAALLIALGAALWPPLSWAGLAGWLWVLGRMGGAWLRQFRGEMFSRHHAASALGAALLGLLLSLLAGGLHAVGLVPAESATIAFITGFLLPLVTGATSHLLPLWWRPQAAAAWQQNVRTVLARYSALRAGLFVAASAGLLLGVRASLLLALAGLGLFVVQVGRVVGGYGRAVR